MEGAQVVVPVRTKEREQRLRDYVGDLNTKRLRCFTAQIGAPRSVAGFRDRVLREFGKVDLAVASVGGWYYGYPLHLMPFEEWKRLLDDNLNTHFLFMQSMLSMLHRQSGREQAVPFHCADGLPDTVDGVESRGVVFRDPGRADCAYGTQPPIRR
jgi:NAD(P)-dependent dehydrogenase (short-subunit alcohol dehydrogenase family)